MAEDSSKTVLAVERAAEVLMLFTKTGTRHLGVSEIARHLGLAKASTYRLLVSLTSHRLVEFDPVSEMYCLGPASITLGMAYLDQIDVRSLARGSMRRLVERTSETATLSIRVDHHRTYLDQVTPFREVKMTVQLGRPATLHAGGASKVFLAYMETEELEEYLDRHELKQYTEHTITDAETLRAELAVIRERGHSVSIMERQVSAGSVAAPIFDHEGQLTAVLGLCGPVERFSPKTEAFSKLVVEESREISLRLGWRG